jgi:hypothetical protein
MGKRSVAYVRMGFRKNGELQPDVQGHAVLIELTRRAGSTQTYSIFDPNNGVFRVDGAANLERTLREYMNSAYAAAGFAMEPEGVSYFKWSPGYVA